MPQLQYRGSVYTVAPQTFETASTEVSAQFLGRRYAIHRPLQVPSRPRPLGLRFLGTPYTAQ